MGHCRFNEAEALKPRIHGVLVWIFKRQQSFNEAEALKPRILFDRPADLADGLERASMRPRH